MKTSSLKALWLSVIACALTIPDLNAQRVHQAPSSSRPTPLQHEKKTTKEDPDKKPKRKETPLLSTENTK